MLAIATLLAALMTRLSELAAVVETDRTDGRSEFCVTGTVSYVLAYQERFCHLLIEDGGTGVDITGSLDPSIAIKPGDRLRLDGRIVPRGAGSIQPEFGYIEVLAHGKPPPAADGPADEIMSGRHDFRRAYLVGELRDVEPSGSNPCWNYVSIISNERQYYAPVPVLGATLAQLEALVGSTVRLDGFPDSHNCSLRFTDERRFMVAGMDKIEILSGPPADPFVAAPGVETLHRTAPELLPRLGRHKASGRLITVWQSRHALLHMDDDRKAVVNFSEATDLKRGDPVEVIGYPSTDGFAIALSRAIGRRIPGAPFAEPDVVALSENDFRDLLSPDFMKKGPLLGRRIRLCGTIADFGDAERERRLFRLSIAGRILEVDFSAVPEAEVALASGCRVSVAGTCVLTSENWAVRSMGVHLDGIRLVMDRPDDLKVLQHPPWWTPGRLTTVVAVLALAILGILGWSLELRHLSEKRGRELFRERSAAAIAELKTSERTRLAAEIHDSISQILTGAAMQLDAGETNAAKRILASCRRELRICLWDLRNHALDAETFSAAVRETLAPHLGGRNAAVDFNIPSSKMSEAMRHAALCIIREATVNAIRHGHAETIAVSGELVGRKLAFTIIDDGHGFNPDNCRGSSDGHYGILGMRERAKAFNGSMTISSTPGNGTEIAVVLEDTADHDDSA